MAETLLPGLYECPIKNGLPELALITDDGETWIGAKRIPDHLLAKVWPHLKPIDVYEDNERTLALIKNWGQNRG